MRQMFVNKVKETESELKEKEREVSMQRLNQGCGALCDECKNLFDSRDS